MDELKAGFFPPLAAPGGPRVFDVGQIAEMQLPSGFVPGKVSDPATDTSFFMEYHSQADPDCKIYFEYRGRRMSQAASDAFRDLLLQPAHSATPDQLNSLREMIQVKADAERFRTMIAKTTTMRGRVVFIIEGVYIKHGLQARTFYVDTDGTGSAVQEITFQAPVDRFGMYVLQGLKALETINWK